MALRWPEFSTMSTAILAAIQALKQERAENARRFDEAIAALERLASAGTSVPAVIGALPSPMQRPALNHAGKPRQRSQKGHLEREILTLLAAHGRPMTGSDIMATLRANGYQWPLSRQIFFKSISRLRKNRRVKEDRTSGLRYLAA